MIFPVLMSLVLGSSILAEDSGGTAATPGSPSSTANSSEGPLSRWLDIDTLSLSLRYRSIFDSDGAHTYNQAQQRSLIQGKAKLDREGKYSVGFRFSSGHYFDWAFADFIGGGTTEGNLKSIPRLASAHDQLDAINSGPKHRSIHPAVGRFCLVNSISMPSR